MKKVVHLKKHETDDDDLEKNHRIRSLFAYKYIQANFIYLVVRISADRWHGGRCGCQYVQRREWAGPRRGLVARRGGAGGGMAKATPGGNSSNCCYVPGSTSNQRGFVRRLGNSLAMLLLSLVRCNNTQLYYFK